MILMSVNSFQIFYFVQNRPHIPQTSDTDYCTIYNSCHEQLAIQMNGSQLGATQNKHKVIIGAQRFFTHPFLVWLRSEKFSFNEDSHTMYSHLLAESA